MNPEEKIRELISKSDATTGLHADKRILGDASELLKRSRHKDSAVTPPNTWRIIMKSPLTKLAATVLFIITCSTGLILWKSTGSGVALAEVLTRIEQVTGYTYQVNSIATGIRTSTVLVSKQDGIKMTITKADPNSVQSQPGRYMVGTEWYLLPRANSLVVLNHKEKTYSRFIYDGVKLDFYKEQYNEPRTIIKQILSCEHKSLGQSVIDGITVEGFQTTDLTYGGGFFGEADRKGELKKVDVKLWVDVNTFLPVRLEEDIVPKKGGRIYEVSYDFRWNVIVNPDDFEPNIPEDYSSKGDFVLSPFSFNEENAVKGLRLFAGLFGDYPVSFEKGVFDVDGKIKRYFSDTRSFEELSDEERKTRKLNEVLLLSAPIDFYETLVQENKDPVYYGETVGPDDVDKVLLRWKKDDSQYRVIFGDLNTKTITAEELAQLEKPSPQ
ncbi:MAG: hypothetical protein JSW66_11830 [Phycisphaerales bacterium]|nr:MAG: hypothetical protein JSW66_11830 [Phycisphaerales bacterium]